MVAPSLLMIVHYFYVKRIPVFPVKADTPLLIDADTPLPLPIPEKLFELICRWDAEKVKSCSAMDLHKLSKSHTLNCLGQLCRESSFENLFRFRAVECLYHCETMLTHSVSIVKEKNKEAN
jgi:hypothetical protein